MTLLQMRTYHVHFVRKFHSLVSMARSQRPARLLWVQLLLRTLALLVSLAALVIAVYVGVVIHRIWYMVIVSVSPNQLCHLVAPTYTCSLSSPLP